MIIFIKNKLIEVYYKKYTKFLFISLFTHLFIYLKKQLNVATRMGSVTTNNRS